MGTTTESAEATITPTWLINADVVSAVNYASWQNSVPLVRALAIQNQTDRSVEGLELELTVDPPVCRKKTWTIDRIPANGKLSISDYHVDLDPSYLKGLNEAERARFTWRLKCKNETLFERVDDIRVLARDEWGGYSSMFELLAAFVTPNDSAVERILKRAGSILEKNGQSSGLDGYQTGDPKRAFLLASSIWSAIAAEKLTYSNPPPSFETSGQKTRRPSQILQNGLATCLDSTLLFAAVIEACGLNPIIVLQNGHCFVGFWLRDRTLPLLVVEDCVEIRKAVHANELVVFETTLITQRPVPDFHAAITIGRSQTSEQNEDAFVAALDIKRARGAQIRPLASHEAVSEKVAHQHQDADVTVSLAAAPDFSNMPVDQIEQKPSTPDGRIQRWQRKLLDLSLRNRLLNFRDSKQVVPLICPNLPEVEDRLAAQKGMRIISSGEHDAVANRDHGLHLRKTGEDLAERFALDALKRNELTSRLTSRELESRLTDLYRRARNDLAEGGSNTLFLAVGFVRWKRPTDPKSHLAPLLLVPVKLERRSAGSSFYLHHHEDEVRFNSTLTQMLRQDFEIDLRHIENDLPKDDSGIDVPKVIDAIRFRIRDVPGFEVVSDAAIATFSFAKYLMWKDLVDRTEHLENNRVVRHLIRDPDKAFQGATKTSIPTSVEVDRRYSPKALIHPLTADSSQLAAVMAAHEGQDFVLIGPPGTGKSQTIANMIAQCMAAKKSVLFVAEKSAALDVVYRRLCHVGLGDYCLELHSNKAERKRFLDQLKHSWLAQSENSEQKWIQISDLLQIRRDQLNSYVRALHHRHPCGLTVFETMGLLVKKRNEHTPRLSWTSTLQHDQRGYETLRDTIQRLALAFSALRPVPVLRYLKTKEWSASWEGKLLTALATVESTAERLSNATAALSESLGLERRTDLSAIELDAISRCCRAILRSPEPDFRVYFHHAEKLPTSFARAEKSASELMASHSKLSATYDESSLDDIPVRELDVKWREAEAAIWPLSWFKKRSTLKMLSSYVKDGVPNPRNDLRLLKVIQEQRKFFQSESELSAIPEWKGIDSDFDAMGSKVEKVTELITSLGVFAKQFDLKQDFLVRIVEMLNTSTTRIELGKRCQSFLLCAKEFTESIKTFHELAGRSPVDNTSRTILSDVRNVAKELREARTEFQRWTAWRSVREQAKGLQIDIFVEELEQRRILPEHSVAAFELAYARWWLPSAIDSSDVLRTFQSYSHENAIVEFRKLDDEARRQASLEVRRLVTPTLPKPNEVPRSSELGLLRHQMELQRPSKSIRDVISGMPETFPRLAPCLLMSPLSIAQYLPTNQALFDVVIFDEASQITTWDAIGAIARGRQTIIVGDPKQLPPTNFFGRSEETESDANTVNEMDRDLESILDETKASGLPTLELNWHYRSRHESLITFSNREYYGNRLITFPSPLTKDQAVRLRHLPNAVYDRGKSCTNKLEAEALTDDAVNYMLEWLKLPENERPTLGIITFNSQQQSLIQDLLDQARRISPELEWFFAEDRIEPTIVKNLENVQGDERDVILFSITYGPSESGRAQSRVPNSFGALNKDGGERRLNVAVTRAKQELVVYCSFLSTQLEAERTLHKGAKDLKIFLDFAERGPVALFGKATNTDRSFDSSFEEAVAGELSQRGWTVIPQIGVSGFRIDLGIVHPDFPGGFLAGVECDGATYHRSASARDRDKVREEVLRGLGWSILRIWSPDWWYDAAGAANKIHKSLTDLLEDDRGRRALEKESEKAEEQVDSPETERGTAPLEKAAETRSFTRYDFALLQPIASALCDESYSPRVAEMVKLLVNHEGPIREADVVQRIARAHNVQRTSARVRDHILQYCVNFLVTDESVGRFLWPENLEPTQQLSYRAPVTEENRRSIDEICTAEMQGFLIAHPEIAKSEDPATSLLRHFGLRNTANNKTRAEELVSVHLGTV